ncbi:peptide chain release factor 1, mitochondrial-like isoform X1 [Acipenser oxyrinchus oxyrinchus]|uniref:Peptide chain release factor 1, mitochondrial-like isoform X1 n=1 Tax=Acipenser oxyrinchus oxyrinchus TaxID=40147 RepID=A0AAD8G9A8_ACIOX|nr:peptide chain release factor 1, mitochondrial-like isoform X1 [Acipenser oxyrinchus oxyrinchus]
MIEEYRQVTQTLSNTAITESERRTMSRRQIELSPMATVFQQSQRAVKDLKDVQAIIESAEAGEDTQMLELAKEEQKGIRKLIETLQTKLLQSLVPSDKHDASDVIVEVAAGRTTGGDICQQFTREIFEMYQNFASYKQWAFEVLNYTPAEYGGLHHAAARIAGESVYRHFKYEGGMHRVQRIPEVGLSSRMQRIHTGTMMVIVLPQPDEVDVIIEPKDLRIDTFRSKGAGGQSVNTTDRAVRLVHIPTGITVECQQERSQLQNRETAMRMLRARIYQQLIEKETEQRQSARKLQVGTRSQSERIRTYNFTQDRVTDHRISYVTRDIKEFLSGGELLEELISELLKSAETEALLELVENSRN